MAVHGRRYKNYFQFGRETVWGNAVAATKRLPFTSYTRGVTRQVVFNESMNGRRGHINAYNTAKVVRPIIEMDVNILGLLMLLDGAMGTDTFGNNGGTTTGVNPYTHNFRMRDLHNSFTLQVGVGDIPTGKVERFTGAKINRMTISGASHERLKVRFEFIAKNFEDNVTPDTVTTTTTECLLFDGLSGTDDGTSLGLPDVSAVEFVWDNAMSERNYSNELIDEPYASGFAQATLRITEEFQTTTALDQYIGSVGVGVSGNPSLTFASGTNFITIGLTGAYLAEPMEAEGDRQMQTLVWRGALDGGSPPSVAAILFRNSQSSINA